MTDKLESWKRMSAMNQIGKHFSRMSGFGDSQSRDDAQSVGTASYYHNKIGGKSSRRQTRSNVLKTLLKQQTMSQYNPNNELQSLIQQASLGGMMSQQQSNKSEAGSGSLDKAHLKKKLVERTMGNLAKDVELNVAFYLKLRKNYDRITIYENLFNRNNQQKRAYKELKKNIKRLVSKFFGSLSTQDTQHSFYQQKSGLQGLQKKVGPPMGVIEEDNEDQKGEENALYEGEVQGLFVEKFHFQVEDFAVNLMQITLVSVLNYLEKIIETEIYILEGTAFEYGDRGGDPYKHKKNKLQVGQLVKEQRRIINFLKLERFYLFLYWNHAGIITAEMVPAMSERDFVYKRCMSAFKRLRQLIYSMNFLFMEKRKKQLLQCYQSIRLFLLETMTLLINNLSSEKKKRQLHIQFKHKHVQLFKTMFGMAEEMLSKNFMEEKKSNQMRVFDQDRLTDETKSRFEGRASNFEELMLSLKDQLDEIDFLEEQEESQTSSRLTEEYENKYYALTGSPNRSRKQDSKALDEADFEGFFSKMVFNGNKAPKPKPNLKVTAFDNQSFTQNTSRFGADVMGKGKRKSNYFEMEGMYQISEARQAFPKTHYMTKKTISQVETLMEYNQHFQCILANLIFSANNPFQENFPFIHDTSFKQKYSEYMMKTLGNKSTLHYIFQEEESQTKLLNQDNEPNQRLKDERHNQQEMVFQLIKQYENKFERNRNNPLNSQMDNPYLHAFSDNRQPKFQENILDNLEKSKIEDASERFRRLVYTDFTFDKRFGNEKIEEKYTKSLLDYKQQSIGGGWTHSRSFRNPAEMSIDDISLQQRRMIEERSVQNQSNYYKDSEYYHDRDEKSSAGSGSVINAKKKRDFNDIIGEDNLNPYKKKAEASWKKESQPLKNKKTESSQATNYWRNFSSSIDQGSDKNSKFQYFSSVFLPRHSFARRLSQSPAKIHETEDSNEEDDEGFADIRNRVKGSFKKRSATIHIPRKNAIGDQYPEKESQNQNSMSNSSMGYLSNMQSNVQRAAPPRKGIMKN